MSGSLEFPVALAAFFASHAIPLRPAIRERLVARFGAAGFGVAFSTLSLAVLIWVIGAANRAPHIEIWPRAAWQSWVPFVAMLAVCLILSLSLGRPNPFSFGGARNDTFDPGRAGLVRWMRHPVLVALAIWSGAHLVPNGSASHVVLFGLFTGFSVIGMGRLDKRKQALMGTQWHVLQSATAAAPIMPRFNSAMEFRIRCAAGLAGYFALIWLHPLVIGVSPLP